MKVSIITVCYNSEVTIEDTLKSIQSQTYHDIEHIVIDGGSADSTNDIINRYAESVAIHVSEPDKGLYDAMNKGIEFATGDIIGILNSDDVYATENSLSQLISGFDSSKVDAVYSDLVHVSEFNLNKVTRLYSSRVFNKFLIRFGFMLPHPTFYVRKTIYDKLGLYKTNYRSAADFELITRFVSNNVTLRRVPLVTIKMREGGVSSNGFRGRVQQNFEIVRACKENDIYTNILFVMLKVPYKVFTLLTRWFVKV
jgi:glycosyltransferase involved in cell wall biosynthesis